jgi:glycosyltransferase involved in cell wall biosynthesis
VIPLVYDSPDLARLKANWKRFGPRYRNAAAVIAISQHARDEGVRVLGLNADRVHVARLGVDANFRPGADGPSDPPYLLVVGEFSRRKGFSEAFAVIDALVDSGYPHRLVVAGRVHNWARQELMALHAAARHPERIELCDFVPDVVSLYQGATGFLVTSRYEGFGLPALEAMACGVPVVAFANSALMEVVDGGGVLVEDGNVEAMTTAIRQIIDSPFLAEEQREKGLAHASTFTWAHSAAVHAEVYRSVVENAS